VENKLVDRDVFAYALEDTDACGVIFKIRDGKVLGRQHYYLNQVDPNQPGEILKNIIQQYYLSSDFIPEEIFLPEEIEDTGLITKWLGKRKQENVSVLVPEKGEKRKLVEMCQKNAQLLLAELKLQKLKYQEHIPYPIQALEKDLHLPKPPRRIEGFDISHIQGTDTVASLVLFEDGKPKKSEYRHYKIETVQGVDDFLSIKEVVERRYRRLISEGKPLPDLIVIDGGKGQLSSAVEVLQKLGIADQPVVGLAKRLEEVFLPGHSDPQNIPKTSSGLRLLQHIRDESHRFAITFHRKLRGKRMVLSELDEIQGIGAGKRKKLLEHFGSVAKLKDASTNEIGSVKGITKTDVKKITRHFYPDEVVD
jgi:excinuclease ABC subunit C